MIKTKVTVGITVFNDYKLINGLLASIEYYTDKNIDFGVVIYDDGSTKENKEKLYKIIDKYKEKFKLLELIDSPVNKGITKAWNELSKHYDSEYIVLLNNDILVTRFWLTSIIYFLENNNCGAVSLPCWYIPAKVMENIPTKLFDKYEIQVIDPITKEFKNNQPIHYVETNDSRPGRVMCPAGMLFGFKKEMYNKISGFDEGTRLFYNEIQFGTDCAILGLTTYALPYPYCYHVWSFTFKNNKEELKPSQQMQKDREFYVSKYGGDITKTDPNNPHARYMPLVKPNTLKWLSHSTKTDYVDKHERDEVVAFYKFNEYQETEQDVIDAGKI